MPESMWAEMPMLRWAVEEEEDAASVERKRRRGRTPPPAPDREDEEAAALAAAVAVAAAVAGWERKAAWDDGGRKRKSTAPAALARRRKVPGRIMAGLGWLASRPVRRKGWLWRGRFLSAAARRGGKFLRRKGALGFPLPHTHTHTPLSRVSVVAVRLQGGRGG